MTMMPIYKRCPKCKRNYSFNPDVGKMLCPYCGLFGRSSLGYAGLRKKIKGRREKK